MYGYGRSTNTMENVPGETEGGGNSNEHHGKKRGIRADAESIVQTQSSRGDTGNDARYLKLRVES